MTDRYQIADAVTVPGDVQPRNVQPRNVQPRNVQPRNVQPRNVQPRNVQPSAAWGPLRPVLWVVLLISLAANGTTSTAGVNPVISGSFGLAALACAAALIVQHRRHRRG